MFSYCISNMFVECDNLISRRIYPVAWPLRSNVTVDRRPHPGQRAAGAGVALMKSGMCGLSRTTRTSQEPQSHRSQPAGSHTLPDTRQEHLLCDLLGLQYVILLFYFFYVPTESIFQWWQMIFCFNWGTGNVWYVGCCRLFFFFLFFGHILLSSHLPNTNSEATPSRRETLHVHIRGTVFIIKFSLVFNHL